VWNGNLTAAALETLAAQARKGVICVRSSRVATGRVGRNAEVDDHKLGLVASLGLNLQNSRVLLRLTLTQTQDARRIQKMFDEH
jgi:L-asparaginase